MVQPKSTDEAHNAQTVSDQHADDLRSMYTIASVGIATLEMLESLLPIAANEVEHESQALSDHFNTLIAHVQKSDTALPNDVKSAVSGIVMCMQFQDRNSQVMENIVAILERYRTMLVEVRDNVGAAARQDAGANPGIAHAVQNILSSIRLSDIRNRYLEALNKAQVSHTSEELPVVGNAFSKDIELF